MSNLKPWREIAVPNDDVLQGKFQESEFAADISSVHRGDAKAEYQNAETFFNRTFITEGMRLLLDSVVQRLCGKGGDPVIQLQTAFGGGKTHTLLAVWHLARGEVPASRLAGVSPILDEAGVSELPKARVAVIDGIAIDASQPRNYGKQPVRTLWGVLAWQLAGADGFDKVRSADEAGVSPGKDALIELLKLSGPCVILMDELVAYLRQFEAGKEHVGGSFDSNVTFIQGLTEAVKSVPGSVLLASLPESRVEAGGAMGEKAMETLGSYFGRVEAVWKPVGTEEAFNIVRRRLFAKVDDLATEENCRAFADLYHQQSDYFPVATQKGDYLREMQQAYPIHPEVFRRLYEDWSSLEKFQRTRGVLQLMALTIHRLWQDDNRDGMILPGSLPLYDAKVRNKLINYLPGQGWDPILERDVDGERSQPFEIDQDARFGAVQAARRVARTIFLGSAPAVEQQSGARGVDVRHVCLGCAQPAQTVATYRDALKRLVDRLHYLNAAEDRYWFDKRPNLRREMEERKRSLQFREDVVPEIRRRVERMMGREHMFAGVHVFAASGDVPDDFSLRLVVLPPDHAYSRTVDNRALPEATGTVENRGDKPRQHRNRLLLLAPDYESARRMNDQAASYLAWKGMDQAVREGKLNLDQLQSKQVKESVSKAEDALKRIVRETYRWLLVPHLPLDRQGRPAKKFEWEVRGLQPGAPSIAREIERVALQEEDVILQWSPVHLRNLLDKWFWKEDQQHVRVVDVWHQMCDYPFMPRLKDSQVLQEAIREGLDSEDYFGYAASVDGERYEGFRFGRSGLVHIDENSVLIERETAQAWRDARETEQPSPSPDPTQPVDPTEPADPGGGTEPVPPPPTAGKTRYYGTATLDPIRAQMQFATLQQEILHHLQAPANARVELRLEIQAENPDGYSTDEERAVRENAQSLKFGQSEFE